MLARVAHPNVVAVHDVGTYESHVFLAMEFIEGQTLREWLASSRSTSEILRIAAGQGLAAATRGVPDRVVAPRRESRGVARCPVVTRVRAQRTHNTRRAGSSPLDDHAQGVSRERAEVSDVGGQDDPVGLGRRDDERVDRRPSARGEAQRSRATGEDLGDALLDVARPEEPVHVRVAAGVAGSALDEHRGGNERRP
jgi:hypothetical protein